MAGPDSSFGGVPVGYCPDEVHMEEDEVQVQVQAEEEEIGETHEREQGEEKGIERAIKSHTWLTTRLRRSAHQHMIHAVWCAIHECAFTAWEKVTWEVYCLHSPSVTADRHQLQAKTAATNKKMNWVHELHQLLDVSQFHDESLEEEGCYLWKSWKGIDSARSSPDHRWDGSWLWLRLGNLIEVASVHSRPICLVWATCVFDVSNIPLWIDGRSGLPVPTYPFRCTSPRSSQFWVANHDILGLVGNDREFLRNFFWDMPSTMRSPLLDDAVRDWESIQSPIVQVLAGFAFNQEMPAGAIDHSLTPINQACWALHFRKCSAQLE